MDVQAASGTATSSPPLPPISFPGFADQSDPSATQSSSAAPAGSAASPTPVDTTRSAAASAVSSAAAGPGEDKSDATLKPLVAKLYNAAEQNVEVSFQVAKGLGEVVTVFTDRSTGKVIVQFPAESLVALAQFFQKLAGNILDAKA